MDIKPPLTPALIRAYARRFSESSVLANAAKLRHVFDYILEESLAGRGASITQQSIATDALGLGQDFDPGRNPIVRVHAGRLRRVLAEYQTSPQADDLVFIEMPLGGYALSFRSAVETLEKAGDDSLPRVGMVEFQGIDLKDSWARLTSLFCEELGKCLATTPGLSWSGILSRAHLDREKLEPAALGRVYPMRFLVDGSIQQSGSEFILRTRVLEAATGVQVWGWKSPERFPAARFTEIADELAQWISEVVATAAPAHFEEAFSPAGDQQLVPESESSSAPY
jgi:TolB-like protein